MRTTSSTPPERRIGMDLELVRSRGQGNRLVPDLRTRLSAEPPIDATVRSCPVSPIFRSVFPFNCHARACGAGRLGWSGAPAVVAWRANPWEYIHPAELTSPPAEVTTPP